MSSIRIRSNSDNTGIIYTINSGDEIEIPITDFDPAMTLSNQVIYG